MKGISSFALRLLVWPSRHVRGAVRAESRKLALVAVVFLAFRFLPDVLPGSGPASEALAMAHEYARDHVLFCLVPAFFIAGAISVFLNQAAVMKYLGAQAPKRVAYPVAAVSGTILAVCSCTVLPLFAGIHRRGAGLGPATAFLYSGPAISVLAIVLTAQVLGAELGMARAFGAIGLAVVIGLLMHGIFRGEEASRAVAPAAMTSLPGSSRRLWQEGFFFACLVGVLVFANWAPPVGSSAGVWAAIFRWKWVVTAAFLAGLAIAVARWFRRDELRLWATSSWDFAKQILPLLLLGVLAAGFLLGRPGHDGLIPSRWVAELVGGTGSSRTSSPRSPARSCTSPRSRRSAFSRGSWAPAWGRGRRSRSCWL